MRRFDCAYGFVDFHTNPFHGNCGALIVYDVCFHPLSGHHYKKRNPWETSHTKTQLDTCAEEVAGLYKEFNEFLKKRLDTNKNKLIMSDAVGGSDGRTRPSIYAMCTKHKWRKGKETFNSNSGNRIVVFETDRPAGVIKRDKKAQ